MQIMDKSITILLILQVLVNRIWSHETLLKDQALNDASALGTSSVDNVKTPISSLKHESFNVCPQWRLEPGEYTLSKGKAFVEAYNMSFDESFYEVENGHLKICMPGWNSENSYPSDSVDKYPISLAYVSVAGIGISVICLFLHLVVFAFFKESRNLQDYNLASLCFSLLVGYLSFLIGHNNIARLTGVLCVLSAAISHFFLLSSFLWMNAISYDILMALVNVTIRKRPPPSAFRVMKFAMNGFYSWGIPLLFVTVALTFDKIENLPLEYRPLFDNGTCWFYHRKSLLVFFAAPAFLLIAMNWVFFGISTYIIISHRVRYDEDHQRGYVKRNFSVFARLTIVMGLTWIVGAVAGSVNSMVLWFIFALLNTLQGLFIFIAFTCNKSVRNTMKKKWKSRLGTKATGSSVVSLYGELDGKSNQSDVAIF